jgi:hypothetical protein
MRMAAQNLIEIQRTLPSFKKSRSRRGNFVKNENKTTTQNPKHQNLKNQPYSKQPLTQDDPKNQEPANPPHDPVHDTIQNKSSAHHDSTRK